LRINVFGNASYATLLRMRDRSLLEKAVPGLSVEWKSIPDVDTINDALVNGGLDIATGPPTSYLTARENGVPARIVAGLSTQPCTIVGRVGLHALAGLRGGERIAVPDEKSYEAVVLELAALRELGDPLACESRVTRKPHAEALVSMQTGRDISAHVSTTPYREVELQDSELVRLVDDRELFDEPATGSLVYALTALRERNRPLLGIFVEVLTQAATEVAADPTDTARLIGETEELKLSRDRVGSILAASGWQPQTRPSGVTRIAELWRQTDRLRQTPTSWSELAFPGVEGN